MPVVDSSRRQLRSQRLDATRKLLDAAAACADPEKRRATLREVAALNADDALTIVSALYHHQQPDAIEESALLSLALDAYVDAVLALDPRSSRDVLAQVAPTLRDAVARFNRDLVRRRAAPGIGGRSTLR